MIIERLYYKLVFLAWVTNVDCLEFVAANEAEVMLKSKLVLLEIITTLCVSYLPLRSVVGYRLLERDFRAKAKHRDFVVIVHQSVSALLPEYWQTIEDVEHQHM